MMIGKEKQIDHERLTVDFLQLEIRVRDFVQLGLTVREILQLENRVRDWCGRLMKMATDRVNCEGEIAARENEGEIAARENEGEE